MGRLVLRSVLLESMVVALGSVLVVRGSGWLLKARVASVLVPVPELATAPATWGHPHSPHSLVPPHLYDRQLKQHAQVCLPLPALRTSPAMLVLHITLTRPRKQSRLLAAYLGTAHATVALLHVSSFLHPPRAPHTLPSNRPPPQHRPILDAQCH